MDSEKNKAIEELYTQGDSIRIIASKVGWSYSEVRKVLGMKVRTTSEARIMAEKMGRMFGPETRSKLSVAGKKAVLAARNMWTAPEREFKNILNSMGIGVVFPKIISETLGIQDDPDGEVSFQYPIGPYVCDFVDTKRRVVYRVQGDFWHGNPILYEEKDLSAAPKRNRRHDKLGRAYLEKQGYVVCDIWESEINWNKDQVISKVRATRESANPPASHAGFAQFDSGAAHQDWTEKLRAIWFKKPKAKTPKASKLCEICSKKFEVIASRKERSRYCSSGCARLARRKVERPSREQLSADIRNMDFVAVAQKYKVSSGAIRKWVHGYGIGYPKYRKGWRA